jgi:hypothetical protein
MKRNRPPFLAGWMLEHFTFGYRNEALSGDLLEEFRSGRSAGWYWRQVLGAIAVGFTRNVRGNRVLILFAALWSMFAPAWLLIVSRMEEHAHLNERFYRMDWPWSSICDMGLLLLANLVFIWAGIVLYLLPDVFGRCGRRLGAIGRGIAASVPILMILWAALIVTPRYFIDIQTTSQRSLGPVSAYAITHLDPPEVRRVVPQEEWSAQYGDPLIIPVVSPLSAITDVHAASLLVRLPFFLVVICALWRVSMSERNEQEGIPT